MKTVGLILVFAVPFLIGRIMAKNSKKGLAESEGFIKLINFSRYKVAAFRTKQAEIFGAFDDEALTRCGFTDELRSIRAGDTHSILYTALQRSRSELAVPEEVYGLICDFAEEFGTLSLEEQIKRCDFFQSELEERVERLRLETNNRAKLFRSLGAAAGAFFVIMFI